MIVRLLNGLDIFVIELLSIDRKCEVLSSLADDSRDGHGGMAQDFGTSARVG